VLEMTIHLPSQKWWYTKFKTEGRICSRPYSICEYGSKGVQNDKRRRNCSQGTHWAVFIPLVFFRKPVILSHQQH